MDVQYDPQDRYFVTPFRNVFAVEELAQPGVLEKLHAQLGSGQIKAIMLRSQNELLWNVADAGDSSYVAEIGDFGRERRIIVGPSDRIDAYLMGEDLLNERLLRLVRNNGGSATGAFLTEALRKSGGRYKDFFPDVALIAFNQLQSQGQLVRTSHRLWGLPTKENHDSLSTHYGPFC